MTARVRVERDGSRVRLTVEGTSVSLSEGEARALALSLGAVSHAETHRAAKKVGQGARVISALAELLKE